MGINVNGHIVSSSSAKVVKPSLSTVLEEIQLILVPESKRHLTVLLSFLHLILPNTVGSNVTTFCFRIEDKDVGSEVEEVRNFDFKVSSVLDVCNFGKCI